MPDQGFRLTYGEKQNESEIFATTPEVNFKEISSHGKAGSSNDSWFNMLFLGDNLPILKTLLGCTSVKAKVKLVYIDPPFSTGQDFRVGIHRSSTISSSKLDEVAYQDRVMGASYLESLRKRLIFLRQLLAEDGSIYVHIDCRVGHYVKVLMDEVFGEEHFINDIARIKCNPKNFPRRAYGNTKDMILFYSKANNYVWNDPRHPFSDEDIVKLFPKLDEDGRHYTTNPLHAPGETRNGPTGKPWRGVPPPRGRHWRYPPDGLERLDRQGLVEWSSKGVPRKKIYADEFLQKGKKKQDVWEFKDPQFPSYPTEKNIEMLKIIIQTSSNPEDIVLDAYCGSGTALVAAQELRRRWIGIDNSDSSIKMTVRRLVESDNCGLFKLLHGMTEKPHL